MPFIECIWTLKTARDSVQLVTPDGCMDILVRASGSTYRVDVIGAMTCPKYSQVEAGTHFVGIRFRPGMAASVLPSGADKITDKTAALGAIWRGDAEALGIKLAHSETAEERCAELEQAFAIARAVPRAQRAIALLVERHGQVSVEEMCDVSHLEERQFRRHCVERTGLTPKMLGRIVRFRRVARILEAGTQESLPQLAADAGYYDQAHMIRDFRAFAKNTPARFRAVS